MSAFAVDRDTGELVRTGGSHRRISGAEEMVQGVRIVWRLIRGEVWLAPNRGVDWINLLQEGVPPQRIEQQMTDEVLQVPGVTAIEFVRDIVIDTETRQGSAEVELLGSLDEQRTMLRLRETITRPIE